MGAPAGRRLHLETRQRCGGDGAKLPVERLETCETKADSLAGNKARHSPLVRSITQAEARDRPVSIRRCREASRRTRSSRERILRFSSLAASATAGRITQSRVYTSHASELLAKATHARKERYVPCRKAHLAASSFTALDESVRIQHARINDGIGWQLDARGNPNLRSFSGEPSLP